MQTAVPRDAATPSLTRLATRVAQLDARLGCHDEWAEQSEAELADWHSRWRAGSAGLELQLEAVERHLGLDDGPQLRVV